MTFPLPQDDSSLDPKNNWLKRYIEVQKLYDKKVVKALQRAQYDATKAMNKLDGDNISARTKRYQTHLVRNELRGIVKNMFQGFVPVINAGQQDAAEAAAQAALKKDAKVLKALFPDPDDRKSWELSFKQSARHGIGAMIMRVTKTELPLSKRIYKSSAFATGTLNNTINSHIARGSSAKELAKAVEKHFRKDVPGGVSYAAMRLARTEINNAFHAMSIEAAQQFPWILDMEWHLSLSHGEEGCLCEFYAEERYFLIDEVPPKPHPQCMCYVTPQGIPFADFVTNMKAGLYDDFYENAFGNTSIKSA
ncbi:capsid maturation protease [Mycobacterium phage Aikoy]|uniref:MuF-like minor capsid protein n=1 Tax=Mycobacterium phage Onyinye TaxID=2686235 RepID=A0A6B9LDB5_9CAUD|nr:minor head protein [Mycobacterium phage Onyinye]QHB37431.1 MuF-like minor capsid protein [Mycobacterium phage Onyinye]WKW85186.1 capsid maturation protease [Mycobacterium phage Aikoy]